MITVYPKAVLVLYHDDFDGIASAAMVANYLRFNYSIVPSAVRFQSVNFHLDGVWGQPTLPFARPDEEIVIVDFRYHPSAWMWFDHHPNPFLNEEHRAHYYAEALPGFKELNWSEPSCGELIFKRWCIEQPDIPWHWEELARAATKIDGARYDNPREPYGSLAPAIRIDRALRHLTEGEKSELIRRLMTGVLEKGLDFVKKQAELSYRQDQATLDRYGDLVTLEGNVAVVDLVDTDIPFLRYAPYHLYPDAEYSVSIFPHGSVVGGVSFSISHSAWKGSSPINLGALVKGNIPGGGGHPFAAGASFLPADYTSPRAAARLAMRKIIALLQRASQPVELEPA